MTAGLPPATTLPARAWLAERWRRRALGLAPHPQLRGFDDAALDAALERALAAEIQAAAQADPPPAPGAAADAATRPIALFGPNDDRRDPWVSLARDPARAAILAHAQRTCYLVGAGAIAARGDGRVRLHHARYGEFHGLCPDEPFHDQPIVIERDGEAAGGYGYTGYLVGPRHVLTCWHGWEHYAYRPQVAVFGYALGPQPGEPTNRAAAEVVPLSPYPLAQARPPDPQQRATPDDWVLLELERPVGLPGASAAPRLGTPRTGQAVYTLGHPCGLPLKLADHARILAADARSFRTDLDTFTGNSGSPVFDARTHALLGLVVEAQKGEGDFEAAPARGCYVANRVDRYVTGQLSVPAAAFAAALGR